MTGTDDTDPELQAAVDEALAEVQGLWPVDRDPPVPDWASVRAERRRTHQLAVLAVVLAFGPALLLAAAIWLRG